MEQQSSSVRINPSPDGTIPVWAEAVVIGGGPAGSSRSENLIRLAQEAGFYDEFGDEFGYSKLKEIDYSQIR
jgi:hypothetical protein